MNPVFLETGLLDNFYAKIPPVTMILINVIYNLQSNIVYNLENHNLLSISSEDIEWYWTFFTQKLVKPHVIVQWKKQDLIGIIWLRAKKLDLWFQKRETPVPLSQMGTQISNFWFFSSFWTKISIFCFDLLKFLQRFQLKIFVFTLYCPIFTNSAETGPSFIPVSLKLVRVSKKGPSFRNWATKKGPFFVPFWHKIG